MVQNEQCCRTNGFGAVCAVIGGSCFGLVNRRDRLQGKESKGVVRRVR
jgi:hypothetical protein